LVDENNILHAVSKGGPRTIEIMDDYIVFVKNMVENNRFVFLPIYQKPLRWTKKTRDYTATQLAKVYKAMAIISDSPMGEI